MVRHLVWTLILLALVVPRLAAQCFWTTDRFRHYTIRQWDDSAEDLVRPIDRHPFAGTPRLRLTFSPGALGLEQMRAMILNRKAPDADRKEAFYHLALQGKAAPPILIDLSKPGLLEPRWELVLVWMMAGVMDRRMVGPLIYYARYGSASIVRTEALSGLTRNLYNREIYTVSKAVGSYQTEIRVGGSSAVDMGEISYGNLLLPGDEKPIANLREALLATPDYWVRSHARSLEAALNGVLIEQRNFIADGFELPWGSNGLPPRIATGAQ